MPTTPLKALIVPNTGDFPGQWGATAVNPDFTAIDGMLGGFQTISLSSANATLSQPSGSITPGAGPTQSQNALIRLTGTLTSNVSLTFPLPGFYIVENLCSGNFVVTLTNGGGGEVVGAPSGRQFHIFSDGTDVRFVNMPEVGSFLDLCASTTPAWMGACTVKPYLLCDGTVYTASSFTALASQLGSTFGGNGINTFGVPDLLNRIRVPKATSTALARLTVGTSGVNGFVWGSSGGDERLQQHSHTVVDPGHTHTMSAANSNTVAGSGGTNVPNYDLTSTTGVRTTGITNATTGGGSSQNVQPSLVHGVTLIKT